MLLFAGSMCFAKLGTGNIWGRMQFHELLMVFPGANATAELAEDPLVKLDTTYVDLILAMETMFPAPEVSGQEATAAGTSLLPIEEDAQQQPPLAIEPVTVPEDLQLRQADADNTLSPSV